MGNKIPESASQKGRYSDSFNDVEFESRLPHATSAMIATAALFVASHALDPAHRSLGNVRHVKFPSRPDSH